MHFFVCYTTEYISIIFTIYEILSKIKPNMFAYIFAYFRKKLFSHKKVIFREY